MELAELFDRVPALARLEWVARGFAPRQSVQMAVQGDTLTLSWLKDGERQWRSTELPQDLCRDGLPMQRQALGELCADLLLDSGFSLPTLDLDVRLPLEACQWRLLEGEGQGGRGDLQVADLRGQSLVLDWPFPVDDAYLGLMPVPGAASADVVVGAQRLMLQAWVDVVEAADLSLHRVDWLLAAAWRELLAAFDQLPAELVWLIRGSGGWRVLLLREGAPELDRWISDQALPIGVAREEALQRELQLLLEAWDGLRGPGAVAGWERSWWITALPDVQAQWLSWLAGTADGPVLGRPSQEALALEDAGLPALDPLLEMAFAAKAGLDLLEERRPELGLKAATPEVYGSRGLLLQGAGWGGGVLLLGLLGWASMVWLEGMQAQQLEALLPVEQLVVTTEAALRGLKRRTAALEKDNKQIAQQLVAVRSGSALLEQMRLITPEGVQLEDLSVSGDTIKLSGAVQEPGSPGPLERINALVLALASLPETKADGVKVVKIMRSEKNKAAAMSFSLTWALDPAAKSSLQQLEQLGAAGMAERLRLLQRQGVAL